MFFVCAFYFNSCRTFETSNQPKAIEDALLIQSRHTEDKVLFDVYCRDGRSHTGVTESQIRHHLICTRVSGTNLVCPRGYMYLSENDNLKITRSRVEGPSSNVHRLEYKSISPIDDYYGAIVMQFSSAKKLDYVRQKFVNNTVRGVCATKVLNSVSSHSITTTGLVNRERTDTTDWINEGSTTGCRDGETRFSILDTAHPEIIVSDSENILSIVKSGASQASIFWTYMDFNDEILRNEVQGHLESHQLVAHCAEGEYSQLGQDGIVFIQRLSPQHAVNDAFQSKQ
jgi:hypothetical protein